MKIINYASDLSAKISINILIAAIVKWTNLKKKNKIDQ